ncbi:hypothetical protein [Azospirillum himalayense]|uniref:Uncharacterized protein n=1 Tax=Azospirillum himalayense TaxID=654847 RepID=A0ABW0GDH6_9PROT
MAWYTQDQLEQRAKDLHEIDRTMVDAIGDFQPGPTWENLPEECRQKWRLKAAEHLDAVSPLDLTRPLRTRAGEPIISAKLSDDGMAIIATVMFAGADTATTASWPINGLYAEGREGEDSIDLVYSDEAA